MKLYKKNSGVETVTRDEAVDEALCFGWIDGQGKKHDDQSWLIRFTPRRKRSIWSKKNRESVGRLTRLKKIQPSGWTEIERAKADGRWDAAYDSPSNMKVPDDFLEALKADENAYEFFKSLNKTNTYAIAWRLQTAKRAETRQKRLEKIVEMMKNGEKFH